MTSYVVFDKDGEILRTGSAPDSMVKQQARDNEFVLKGDADDLFDYVEPFSGAIKGKQSHKSIKINKTTLKADGIDSVIISGLGLKSRIIIHDDEYHNPDSEFEFTVNLPGEYDIICRSINQLEKTFKVTAT
jgi:hypothetical protein